MPDDNPNPCSGISQVKRGDAALARMLASLSSQPTYSERSKIQQQSAPAPTLQVWLPSPGSEFSPRPMVHVYGPPPAYGLMNGASTDAAPPEVHGSSRPPSAQASPRSVHHGATVFNVRGGGALPPSAAGPRRSQGGSSTKPQSNATGSRAPSARAGDVSSQPLGKNACLLVGMTLSKRTPLESVSSPSPRSVLSDQLYQKKGQAMLAASSVATNRVQPSVPSRSASPQLARLGMHVHVNTLSSDEVADAAMGGTTHRPRMAREAFPNQRAASRVGKLAQPMLTVPDGSSTALPSSAGSWEPLEMPDQRTMSISRGFRAHPLTSSPVTVSRATPRLSASPGA